MANQTHTVVKGDTLSEIALKYGKTVKQLAAWNGIENIHRIYIGQVIKLYNPGKTSSSPSKSSNKPTIKQFGLQSNSENTLFAVWEWGKESTTESYKVLWRYDLGDSTWFVGSNSSNTVDHNYRAGSRISTFNIPDGAYNVYFKVLPVAKKKKDSKGNEKAQWTAEWSTNKKYTVKNPLEPPSAPTLDRDGLKLTASLANVNIPNADGIEFKFVKNNTSIVGGTCKATIKYSQASYVYNGAAGSEYKVCCRAYKGKTYSDWSSYSGTVVTRPGAVKKITNIGARTKNSILIEWEYGDLTTTRVKSFEIEYVTEKRYFAGSGEIKKVSGVETTRYEITGLETDKTYFFRVRAVNDAGESPWSPIVSTVLGSTPAPPTTWSSTNTVITGEDLYLYWIHNSEDGSKCTKFQYEIKFPDDETVYNRVQSVSGSYDNGRIKYTPPKEDEENANGQLYIYTNRYTDGTEIRWRIRTAGVTNELGDWSTERTVNIYAQPTLELSVTNSQGGSIDTIESFPFYVRGLAGPNTQLPIGYALTVISNETYETVDNIGNTKIVKAGEEVYSKYFDTTDSLLVEFTPGNIDLENNVDYKVICVVSMDSGLTAEASCDFTVAWTDEIYTPNVEITYDPDTYVTYLRPYCELVESEYRKVLETDGVYTVSDQAFDNVFIEEELVGVTTTTGEQVCRCTTGDGEETLMCIVENATLIEDVTLSVYRREFDGTFTEIATGLDNVANTHVTDPHPALDYARYRIVATSNTTGAIGYHDSPGYPIGEKAAIIQWDEAWSVFDTKGQDDPLDQPAWGGSLLRLPYNIDISPSNSPDVTLIKYVGRKRPVSYYGTHLGETDTWNVEVPKDDEETLYALRRLSIWMGDVYVREPSGSGYWANITVSFSQKHCEVTIPVSISITRVEGGM